MRARLPRWAYVAMAGGLMLFVLGRVVWSRMARPKPYFTYSMSALGEQDYDALAARPGWAKSTLHMPDGVSLAGLVRRAPQADAPWVLFFPGNDATQLARGQALLERIRGDHSWGLALYASRGYDASGGSPSPHDFAEDAKRVYAALLSQYELSPSQLHLAAFSLGGYSALHVVNHAARQNQKPASLSLLASVARVAMVHSDFWANFGTGDVYDVLPILHETPGPVLVLEGGADEAFAELPQGQLLAQKLGERGRYVELADVGHSSLLESEAAITMVRAMVEDHAKK